MTLVEFIAPLGKSTRRNQVLAVMYFASRYDSVEAQTVDDIRAAMKKARVAGHAKVNVADVLAKCGPYVDSSGSRGKKLLWQLTETGRTEVRNLLGLPDADPEIEHDAAALTGIATKLADADARAYVEEAIKCLQIGALRAAVVFLWSGAIRTLHGRALAFGGKALNTALRKHDQKARDVSSIEDFAYIKDSLALLACKELTVLDKSQRDTLEEALGLRNRCGHPGRYRPGIKKASSFIEDLVTIVWK